MVMSCADADESGEDFGSTPSSSSSENDDATDGSTLFCPIPERWTPEQRTVLLLRVEDWKASKNAKSQQLILQGAMTDLQCLAVAPEMDGLKLVSNVFSNIAPGVIMVHPSVSRPGTDRTLGNSPRLPLASCHHVTKSSPTSTPPKSRPQLFKRIPAWSEGSQVGWRNIRGSMERLTRGLREIASKMQRSRS